MLTIAAITCVLQSQIAVRLRLVWDVSPDILARLWLVLVNPTQYLRDLGAIVRVMQGEVRPCCSFQRPLDLLDIEQTRHLDYTRT